MAATLVFARPPQLDGMDVYNAFVLFGCLAVAFSLSAVPVLGSGAAAVRSDIDSMRGSSLMSLVGCRSSEDERAYGGQRKWKRAERVEGWWSGCLRQFKIQFKRLVLHL